MARPDQLEMDTTPKAKNRATGIKVNEISFVDQPAVPKARFLVVKRKKDGIDVEKADTKTENGQEFPAEAYLYTPGSPSTWKLRIWESPEAKVTRAQLGRAAAALGKGFRGQKVDLPADEVGTIKAKLRGLYADLKVPKEEIPAQVQKCDSCGGMMGQDEDDDDDGEQKDKATVNYRVGGTDDDGDSIVDQCGSCQFFEGPLTLEGGQVTVGDCSLVDGDIGSNMLCDLYEVAEAFSVAEKSKRLATVAKEGRMLSAANLEKMKAAMKAAKDAVDAMQSMMDAAMPAAKRGETATELTPEEIATLNRIKVSLESR